jgi:hypothetical protein
VVGQGSHGLKKVENPLLIAIGLFTEIELEDVYMKVRAMEGNC